VRRKGLSEIIKYRQLGEALYEIQDLALKDFDVGSKVVLFTEEDSKRLQEQALKIYEEARARAQKLVKDAEEEAKSLVSLAEQKVEDYRKEGLQQGYDEGLKKAEAEMEEKYSKLFEAEAQQLRSFMESLKDSYKNMIKTSEAPLVKLAMDIAKKVIKDEAEKNEQVILQNIRDSLLKLSTKASIVIKVNPDQFDLVQKNKDKLIHAVEGIDDFELKNDPKVDKGGCVIETPSGSVEARIDKQLKELRKVVSGQEKEEIDVSGNT
jgi:flagellar assembly protein FliH